MSEAMKKLKDGIFDDNPVFIQLLGMCPFLAVTTSANNGLGMGLTTTAVLVISNAFISMIRKLVPDRVRLPIYIVVIASLVTILQMLLEAFMPELNAALGIYIPLIVVNCIILGRAESYASKNGVINSLFDGIGMGLGFTFALTLLGAFREVIGAGKLFGLSVMPASYVPATIFILAPGGFIVTGLIIMVQNIQRKKKGLPPVEFSCDCCALEGVCNIPEHQASLETVEIADKKANAEEVQL